MKSDQPKCYEHIIVRAGPFHLFMDDFKSNNRMFEEILNWLLGGMYSGNLNVALPQIVARLPAVMTNHSLHP
jgi:hypothetical protein